MNVQQITAIVETAISNCSDTKSIQLIRKLLITPRCEKRPWDYGSENEAFPCWIIAEHPASNTAIAYCEYGFGPKCPWGLSFIAGKHLNMGMDSSWFSSLENAIKDSFA